MSTITNEFNAIVALRLKRFQYLLKYANLDCKQYQIDGVEFCLRSELRPVEKIAGNILPRGGFIADEMGLGKTILMIGLMFSNIVGRTLIVVPPILIHQWYNEIYRITGHCPTVYYGNKKKKINMEDLKNSRIVLTSYNAIAISKKNKKLAIIHQVMWGRVIFDEAHHLRNRNTTRFLGCKNIRATNRWVVTGTPIQNKKGDFYSLCDALGLDSFFYKKEENTQLIREKYLLYRTKKSVGIILPEVEEINYVVPWQNKQEKIISEDFHSLLPVSGVTSKKSGFYSKHIADAGPLIALLRAKQSCIMLSLMKHLFTSESETEEKNELALFATGSKVDAVVKKLLSRKDNGKGKIVFCHFREEINYISQKLINEGLVVLTMDGRVKGKKRLDYLKMRADVMILQIQTGCEGLNLQEYYSEVYFVSPHWNPSIEDQAVARCHRIGQTKEVQVFRFVMKGFEKEAEEKVDPITLEKYIQSVQGEKRKIAEEILI